MKKFLALLTLSSMLIIGCNKEKTKQENNATFDSSLVNPLSKFAVDSLKLEDSLRIDKNLSLTFSSKIITFSGLESKTVLDSIYAQEDLILEDYSKENLAKALHQKMQNYYDEEKLSLKEYKPEFSQFWNMTSAMEMISHQNQYLTIQYTGDGYTGGAHGYYYEKYKVFDLKNNKTVQLSDVITKEDSSVWKRILMDNFLKNDSENKQAEMLLVEEIPLNNNYYFDKENLYFLYNQYEITAYAAGPVLIKIPFSDIKPFLNSDFKKRMNL